MNQCVWRSCLDAVRNCSCASLLGLAAGPAHGDATYVYAVQINATIQSSPPLITLNWEADPFGATSYTIYRKAKDATSWGTAVASLGGAVTNYTDASVALGQTYEYQIVKVGTLGYQGYGYIDTGISAPLIETRGKLALVVATNSTLGLEAELARLQSDLVGDGWMVSRHDVSSNATPESVRAAITNDYYADPQHFNAVFLFGHVPTLESGNGDYDGHYFRPMAADAFYADVNNDWPTDPTNSPDWLPSDVKLMVGRVDFFNMPGVGAMSPWPDETELLRNYLNKDHRWRHKLIAVPRLALMGNRRGDEDGEATAASGYRNFQPLVGPGNTIEANVQDDAPLDQRWISMLSSNSYLWAYGCGGGLTDGLSGLGTNPPYNYVLSTDVVGQDAKAVFVMLFGSYFGNWDVQDDLMRAFLATPTLGLACCMAGRPHWFVHHMGLGETIGYGTRLTMNNSTLYQNQSNGYPRAVYIALMGDPTLRMEPVAPPINLSAAAVAGTVNVGWDASPESVAGYHVYRAATPTGPFLRLTGTLQTATRFTDTTAGSNVVTYMVRAVKLQTNFSGSYFNPSQGSFVTVDPAQPSVSPIVVQITGDLNGLTLSWNSQVGTVYRVEAAANLAQTNWTDLSGTLIANSAQLSWTDPNANAAGQRFYRIVTP